jgi:hypothetical protein
LFCSRSNRANTVQSSAGFSALSIMEAFRDCSPALRLTPQASVVDHQACAPIGCV